MALVLLIGGARSGKSRLAARMALEQSDPVTFLASAEAGDDEMAAKIDRHQRERPRGWETVVAPLHLREAIASVPGERCLIIDCLTVWTANLIASGGGAEPRAQAADAAAIAAARPGLTIAVTNEVGLGVHPYTPLGREFRELLGSVNLAWADVSDRVYLVVAGRALALDGAPWPVLDAAPSPVLDAAPSPVLDAAPSALPEEPA